MSSPSIAPEYDAVVVGSGPNGLAAAIALAQAGRSVVVFEGRDTPGGGVTSAELTLPGFVHDPCSTVHPLAKASPFFRSLHLETEGVVWRESMAPLTHLVDESHAVSLERSISATAVQLGQDSTHYEDLMGPLVDRFDDLLADFLGPPRLPSHPGVSLRFGLQAIKSMNGLATRFTDPKTRALLAGTATHAMLPLDTRGTAAFALMLAAAGHAVGWPVIEGGSGVLARALVAKLQAAGGELRLGTFVRSRWDLPRARVYLFDVTPRQLLTLCEDWHSPRYRRRLERFEYGPGVFKIDWALSGPVHWTHPHARRAATVHLAGTLEQVHAAEKTVREGQNPKEPFLLFVQPTVADTTRTPPGQHTASAYCHVPSGSTEDLTERVEAYIERFAPGFRELILGRHSRSAAQMEAYNPNFVGGDINGGAATLQQVLFRPVVSLNPYATSNPDVFICSSSTPPGGGVHGLCGYWAAQSALKRLK